MVSEDDASRDKNLEESTRQHNSNLQDLIDAVGGLLAASGDLLARLQQILSRGQSDAGQSGPSPSDKSEATDYREG